MPIQQMFLSSGKIPEKLYIDDVFSTFLYKGNSSTQTITNGIDLSGEGGLVWFKNRTTNVGVPLGHVLVDTVRGKTKYNRSQSTSAEETANNMITSFNSNGFAIGDNSNINYNNDTEISWTFRKASGFFDVVTYTGDGSASRQISHQLKSVPGMVIVKNIDSGYNWTVWHKSEPTKYGKLNDNSMFNTTTDYFGNSSGPITPTSTYFTVNGNQVQNGSGVDYVAYVFAGGASTASEAVSVDFTGSTSAKLSMSSSSDLAFGTGDFTMECWVKPTNLSSTLETVFDSGNSGSNNADSIYFGFSQSQVHVGSYNAYYNQASTTNFNGQWMHIAVSRSGTNLRIFKNGILLKTTTNNTDLKSGGDIILGINPRATYQTLTGSISNFRAVKGQALYTTSFIPSTSPLTTTSQGATASNVKLLCCQSSTVTTATVAPGTITNTNTTASSDSPFDDPAGFVFGESGSENVIKCGSFTTAGNGAATVDIGWEPSFVIMKRADGGAGWYMFDSMRGFPVDGNSGRLSADESDAEQSMSNYNVVSSSGFSVNNINTNSTHVFIAIRFPDGYCGKPPELGNQVFTPVFGSANAPLFKANNHVVDFTLQKNSNFATQSADWNATSRLTSGKLLQPNTNAAETSNTFQVFDYQSGTSSFTGGTGIRFGWLWKRHAGFDVVCYKGDGVVGRQIRHNLGSNNVPEMMWVKARTQSSARDWQVYHKGLNGGSNPEQYNLWLNRTDGENDSSGRWNDTAPTSTHFTIGGVDLINESSYNYIVMLFASISGISAVGSYTGNGSTQTISTGFAPRFIIIRRTDGSEDNWVVLDTTRGWGSGDEHLLKLNSSDAQSTSDDFGAPTSSGFSLTSDGWVNYNTGNYIYYAHS